MAPCRHVTLVSPPFWYAVHGPPLALPCLAGFLQQEGFTVSAVDLNIRMIHDEELHRPGTRVQRRMKPALRHEDRASRSNLHGDRIALFVLHHLLAVPGDHEDDLLRARMVVSRMALAGRQVDDAAREPLRAVDLRRDRQRQPAPVEAEGVDVLRIDEIVFRVAHGGSSQ